MDPVLSHSYLHLRVVHGRSLVSIQESFGTPISIIAIFRSSIGPHCPTQAVSISYALTKEKPLHVWVFLLVRVQSPCSYLHQCFSIPARSPQFSYRIRVASHLEWVVLGCDLGGVKAGEERNLFQDIFLDLWHCIEEHYGECASCYAEASCHCAAVGRCVSIGTPCTIVMPRFEMRRRTSSSPCQRPFQRREA